MFSAATFSHMSETINRLKEQIESDTLVHNIPPCDVGLYGVTALLTATIEFAVYNNVGVDHLQSILKAGIDKLRRLMPKVRS